MTAPSVELTLEIRTEDGSCTEFFLDQEDSVNRTLRLLANPRLLTQSHLVLTSEHGVNVIPCGGIDMILARTLARTPAIFPLIFPAGLLDLLEQPRDWARADSTATVDYPADDPRPLSPLTSYVEIHSFGGWAVTLKALVMAHGPVQDRRHPFAHFFDLPIIAFRLMDGGIGLINPRNISRVSAQPVLHTVPDLALPAQLEKAAAPTDRARKHLRDRSGPQTVRADHS